MPPAAVLLENEAAILDDHSLNLFKARYNFVISAISETSGIISVLSIIGHFLVIPIMALSWMLLMEDSDTSFLHFFKWSFFPIAAYYASRVYFLNAYLSNIQSESKKLYSVLNSIIARGKISEEGKKSTLIIIQSLSGRTNRMAYRDSTGSIVEQMDVLSNISATLQLLLLGLVFKNKI